MIQNDALINALRSLGYRFKKQTDRMMLYKRSGSSDRVMVRRNSAHSPEYARTVLKQAGMPPDQIDSFINSTNN